MEISELVDAASALVLGVRMREQARSHATSLRSAAERSASTLAPLFARRRVTAEIVATDLDVLAGLNRGAEVRRVTARCRRRVRLTLAGIQQAHAQFEAQLSAIRETPNEDLDESARRQRDRLQHQASDLRDVWSFLRDVEEWLFGNAGQLLADQQCILLLGPWGTGKTHFVCDFAL